MITVAGGYELKQKRSEIRVIDRSTAAMINYIKERERNRNSHPGCIRYLLN